MAYVYDPVGRLTGIWAPNGDPIAYVHDAGGRLMEKWFPNGVNTRYSYNVDNTLSQIVNRNPSGGIVSQHDYSYDGVGNRATHMELINGVTTPYKYVYDELNRLTEVRNNATGALIESYAYDPLHNRARKTAGGTTYYYSVERWSDNVYRLRGYYFKHAEFPASAVTGVEECRVNPRWFSNNIITMITRTRPNYKVMLQDEREFYLPGEIDRINDLVELLKSAHKTS